jgi:hypothetical protein
LHIKSITLRYLCPPIPAPHLLGLLSELPQ